MIGKIEVYIKTEEAVIGQAIIGRPISDGVTTHYCTVKESFKTEKVMSETDRMALEVVKEFANARGLSFEVYDVSTLKGKLTARLKGIKMTPAIIIGKVKIEGEYPSEVLRSKLESYFKE